MEKTLEQKIGDLEKRVAELEVRVQEQPNVINIKAPSNINYTDLKNPQYLQEKNLLFGHSAR